MGQRQKRQSTSAAPTAVNGDGGSSLLCLLVKRRCLTSLVLLVEGLAHSISYSTRCRYSVSRVRLLVTPDCFFFSSGTRATSQPAADQTKVSLNVQAGSQPTTGELSRIQEILLRKKRTLAYGLPGQAVSEISEPCQDLISWEEVSDSRVPLASTVCPPECSLSAPTPGPTGMSPKTLAAVGTALVMT